MKKCRFKNVVVIGCGKIAVTAIKYIASLKEMYGFSLCFIQHEMQELNAVSKVCRENEISLLTLPQKEDVTKELSKFNTETLIVSAGNYYLFPKCLLEKDNITTINFHNALLPKYPGRNAPSWAIYYGEKESGATWHLVTESVDSGAVLWQGACEIAEDTKAYELTAKIMELAQNGLEEFLPKVLEGTEVSYPQTVDVNRKMYYAKDVPSDGYVKITDEPSFIYRVLRSVDYGKMGPFAPIVMEMNDGKQVEIIRYKKKDGEICADEKRENSLVLELDENKKLILKYKVKE